MCLRDVIKDSELYQSGEPFLSADMAAVIDRPTTSTGVALNKMRLRGQVQIVGSAYVNRSKRALWRKPGDFLVLRAGLYSDKELGIASA